MSLNKKFTDVDFNVFERDLLSVLKSDEDHKLDFDGKLLIKSRRYDCLLAATDVHWDESSGDIVLVGAFRSGKAVMDETKSYPVMKTRISIPLKECFEDLKVSSGEEMRLVSKAKKAVLDKYFVSLVNKFKSHGMFDGEIMNLESFGCGTFRMNNSYVVAIANGSDGKSCLVCSNSLNPEFTVGPEKSKLKDIQNICNDIAVIEQKYVNARKLYVDKMLELNPVSMTLSSLDSMKNTCTALAAVYDSGCPLRILDCVAKHMAGMDVFDTTRHTPKEIVRMMDNYRKTGTFESVQKKSIGRQI